MVNQNEKQNEKQKVSDLIYRVVSLFMGKKCVPGLFCIENMTLFVLIFLLIVVIYIYYTQTKNGMNPIIVIGGGGGSGSGDRGSGTTDIYGDGPLGNTSSGDMYRPPQNNMWSSPAEKRMLGGEHPRNRNEPYTQVGILTRTNGSEMILPLMGRILDGRRGKTQYYTMSNQGAVQSKLPVSRNGRSCTGEYGCDEISNGDTVYVQGYDDVFRATIYENNTFYY